MNTFVSFLDLIVFDLGRLSYYVYSHYDIIWFCYIFSVVYYQLITCGRGQWREPRDIVVILLAPSQNVVDLFCFYVFVTVDYTVWPFWVDTHVAPPFKRDAQ